MTMTFVFKITKSSRVEFPFYAIAIEDTKEKAEESVRATFSEIISLELVRSSHVAPTSGCALYVGIVK